MKNNKNSQKSTYIHLIYTGKNILLTDFKFETSPYPPSLFKDALIRKPDKPTL